MVVFIAQALRPLGPFFHASLSNIVEGTDARVAAFIGTFLGQGEVLGLEALFRRA
jgi:hypothetical protein